MIWTQKLEAFDPFYFVPIDVDRGMFSFMLREVDDNLLRFVDIEGEIIVVAPAHQILFVQTTSFSKTQNPEHS